MFKVWKYSKGVFDEVIIIFLDHIKIILQRFSLIESNEEYIPAKWFLGDEIQLIVIDVYYSHKLHTNYNPYNRILPDGLEFEMSCQYWKAK